MQSDLVQNTVQNQYYDSETVASVKPYNATPPIDVYQAIKERSEKQNALNKLAGGAKGRRRSSVRRNSRRRRTMRRKGGKKARKTMVRCKRTRQHARRGGGLPSGKQLPCPTFLNASKQTNENSQMLNQLLVNSQVQSLGDKCASGKCPPIPVSEVGNHDGSP